MTLIKIYTGHGKCGLTCIGSRGHKFVCHGSEQGPACTGYREQGYVSVINAPLNKLYTIAHTEDTQISHT